MKNDRKLENIGFFLTCFQQFYSISIDFSKWM